MKALIKVGYACNENCTFCHTADVRHIDGSADEVHAKIERAAKLGHSMIVFSGGEATIRPELFDWAAHANRLGLDVGLVTNGLMLAYPEFLERLLAHRLRYVYMSLHGGTPKVHNLMVRADSFEAARRAIHNVSGRGLDLTINCVVTRANVDHLKGLVDALLPYRDLRLKFSMVQPKGRGDALFDFVMPRVSEVARRVHEAISYGVERSGGHGPRFGHDGLPLCLLPGFEDLYDDLKTHRFWSMVEIGEPDFFPVDDRAKVHPRECDGCALKGPCPGLFRGYHQEFGAGELKPVTGRARSNSFNYAFETLVSTGCAATSADDCPVREAGVTPWDRGRHLFVRNGPRLARFRTDTRDFADEELEHVKHGLGQVYVDASRKPAPDDFARDLVQLRRSSICAPCPEEPRCTGLFEPVLEDVFTRDDARVRELVAALAGDVLDVGCGEGPYEDLLAPAARDGRIRYVGLDPEASRIAALRTRWPWASLEVGTAEDFAERSGRQFDHVLVLRSWNHLRDPRAAAAGLARAIRPGGTLTIVDNTAFGLARTRAQAARGEGSTAMFEHYRNDTAADAATLFGDTGLEEVERREVGPGTSNQWLLRFARPARPD